MKNRIRKLINIYIPKPFIEKYLIGIMGHKYWMQVGIDKQDIGLEIGPSHNPVVPKKEGYHVEIIDYLSRQGLIEKYKMENVDFEAIEDVDYVWRGEKYSTLTGKKDYYDYVIASHVIEHTTDFIGFVNDCTDIIKEMGIIVLAIPDKRYTFDCFRENSSLAEVIDESFCNKKIHSAGRVAECTLNTVRRRGKDSWKWIDKIRYPGAGYAFSNDYNLARYSIDRIHNFSDYMDIHNYVFTPASFRLMILDLQVLGYINVTVEKMKSSRGGEFVVVLKKTHEMARENYLYRLNLLKKIKRGK